MIDNLYIFNSSGKLHFSKNWKSQGSVEEDPVLVSGFLSAIWMFAKKIGSKGGIRSIQTDNNLLVGIASPTYNLLFVLVSEPNSDIGACKSLLTRVRQSFLQKYRTNLRNDCDFTLEDCNDWLENLEKIVEETDIAPVESLMKRFLKDIVDNSKDERKE